MKQLFTTKLSTSRRLSLTVLALAAATAIQAATITLTVKDTRKQTITGFGAACCDGAMCPYGTDTNPVRLRY
jgi:glucuronoarabinoxylan endo-1,4-beta-xylanase